MSDLAPRCSFYTRTAVADGFRYEQVSIPGGRMVKVKLKDYGVRREPEAPGDKASQGEA